MITTMEVSTVFLVILILSFGTKYISGLQCPTCTYFIVDENMHSIKRTIGNVLFDHFKEKVCASTNAPLNTIPLEKCLNIPGKKSYCSFMKGEVTMRIPMTVLRDADMKLQVINRGCFYSSSNKFTSNGCHKRHTRIHEASFIEQVVNREIKPVESYKVLEFDGETCLCSDMYCKEISSASKSSPCTAIKIKTVFQLSVIFVIIKSISGSL